MKRWYGSMRGRAGFPANSVSGGEVGSLIPVGGGVVDGEEAPIIFGTVTGAGSRRSSTVARAVVTSTEGKLC